MRRSGAIPSESAMIVISLARVRTVGRKGQYAGSLTADFPIIGRFFPGNGANSGKRVEAQGLAGRRKDRGRHISGEKQQKGRKVKEGLKDLKRLTETNDMKGGSEEE